MRKNLELIGIILVGFIYLISITKLKNSYEQNVIIINYTCDFLKVIFSTTMLIVAFNNLETRVNSKASYLALSYSLLIYAMLIALNLYNNGVNWQHNMQYLKMKWLINLCEILWVFICALRIHSKKSMIRWVKGQAIVVGLISIFLFYGNVPINGLVNEHGYKKLIILAHMICLLIIVTGNSVCINKVKPYTHIFRCYWCVFTALQFIYHGLIIGFVIKGAMIMLILGQVASVMCYICVLNFIKYMTLGVAWKEMDQGIVVKSEQLNEENVENKLLIKSAHIIDEEVQKINVKVQHLNQKLKAENDQYHIKYVSKIANNCNRLTKLSKNIVDLNNMERGKDNIIFQTTNLTELVEMLIASVEPYVERLGIKLEYKKGKSPVYCNIDAEALERVMLNLISNAIKYNKQGGSIQIYVTEKNQRAFVCVKDTGIGIPKEKLQAMFNRFERGDSGLARKQEGSGLGLAIVKSIIERHKGEVKILSIEGKGTLVSMNLPVCEEYRVTASQSSRGDEQVLKKKIEVEFSDLGMS